MKLYQMLCVCVCEDSEDSEDQKQFFFKNELLLYKVYIDCILQVDFNLSLYLIWKLKFGNGG